MSDLEIRYLGTRPSRPRIEKRAIKLDDIMTAWNWSWILGCGLAIFEDLGYIILYLSTSGE
jgi:hypothetical protein